MEKTDSREIWNEVSRWREILARDKNNVEARFNLGEFYFKIGRFELALKEFKIAKAVSPQHPGVRSRIAEIYRSWGKLKESARELEKIYRLDSCSVASIIDLGDIYTELGELEKAEKVYRYALEKAPENISLRLKLEKISNRK